MIQVKRIYAPFERSDGHRVLVDRLWPRGLKKVDARLDAWLKDLAPSRDLRAWFAHDVTRWDEFARRYVEELSDPRVAELLERLQEIAESGTLTLLFAARDEQRNNAIVLKDVLESRLARD